VITTIQLNESVKNELDKLKDKKETYEEVILNLMKIAEKQKREQEQLMIEGCKEMAEESLKIAKEWEGTLMDGLEDEKW
jgi:predicted CopG family antitoxin